MKDIAALVRQIDEEVCDAEKYAKCAAKLKDTDTIRSQIYTRLANEELGHADTLHGAAVKMIKDYQAKGHDAPDAMQAVWDWEHDKYIDHVARIKLLLK